MAVTTGIIGSRRVMLQATPSATNTPTISAPVAA